MAASSFSCLGVSRGADIAIAVNQACHRRRVFSCVWCCTVLLDHLGLVYVLVEVAQVLLGHPALDILDCGVEGASLLAEAETSRNKCGGGRVGRTRQLGQALRWVTMAVDAVLERQLW